jgi:LysM repeat protein
VDTLRVENQLLKQQLQTWQNYYAGRGVNPTIITQSPAPAPPPPANTEVARQETPAIRPVVNPAPRVVPSPVSNRLHTIGSGETLAGIARRYNVKLSALQSANPTMDAKRLRPGQALVIPPP